MEWLFGRRKVRRAAWAAPARCRPLSLALSLALVPCPSAQTPAELLRENKRMLDKAIRELDRERLGLQSQENKLKGEIKKMAKQGQMVRGLWRGGPRRQQAPPLPLGDQA